jgi:hypothetical protein
MAEEKVVVTKNYYGGFRHGGEAVYGLGFVGAAIYFIIHAPTFWIGALGILKAIVWPAILVFKLLGFLNL